MFDEKILPFIASISPTVMWIAITVGLLLFVIGYFAGGNKTLGRIGMCVLLVIIVGALALPAPMKLYSLVERGLNLQTVIISTGEQDTTKSAVAKQSTPTTRTKTAPTGSNNGSEVVYENAPVSLQLFTFLLYLLWTAFLVGMGIFLYETFTVTAEEAEKH
ncbi:hypothetical protein L0337_27285 [candidate division KSB1 bacterium]|nr:hypothetical protein [candidate division KSB1 bacterium]